MLKWLKWIWSHLRWQFNSNQQPTQNETPDVEAGDMSELVSEKFQPSTQPKNVWVTLDKGWVLASLLLSSMGILPAYGYFYAHGIHLFSPDFDWPKTFDFLGPRNLGPIIFEGAVWAGIAFLVRRLHTIAVDVRRRNFSPSRYLLTVLPGWLNTVVIVSMTYFVLYTLDLGILGLKLRTLEIDQLILLSFFLGYFSDETWTFLRRITHNAMNGRSPDCSNCPCTKCKNYQLRR